MKQSSITRVLMPLRLFHKKGHFYFHMQAVFGHINCLVVFVDKNFMSLLIYMYFVSKNVWRDGNAVICLQILSAYDKKCIIERVSSYEILCIVPCVS